MKEELEKLAASGKINRRHIEPILKLNEFGYCQHRSWGFGRILEIDTVLGRMTIDFESKPGHHMALSFAAENLKPIPQDHILALKATDLDTLRQMAAATPVDLVRVVINSFAGKATVTQIQKTLVPEVIDSDWKKWWDSVKRALSKDGHFKMPIKKSDPIIFHEEEIPLQEQLMSDFRKAKGLKARMIVAAEILKNLNDLDDKHSAASEIVDAMNAEIDTHKRTQPSIALEAVFLRNDIRKAANLPDSPNEVTETDIWRQELSVNEIMEGVQALKYKHAVQSFKHAFPEQWANVLMTSINDVSAKLCGEYADALISEGYFDQLKEIIARHINQHTAESELLLWLAKSRSDAFADILGPEVFRAILTAIERDQFSEKRSNRLGDFLLADSTFFEQLLDSADLEVIKDLTRALQFASCFNDVDKRSLLGRIVKHSPAAQTMISSDQKQVTDTALIVSWESLNQRKKDYDKLVHKKIPANSHEIAIARSYGDLSENHEYKAAKEMQKLLMKQKAELENQLVHARGTDFKNPQTDSVNVGTTVTLTNLDNGENEIYSILGAWDFDDEKSIISYLSPVGRALLNHKPGDTVEIELDNNKKRLRVERIDAAIASESESDN
ncbi:MAG: GreA/GreB family elongation factor [Verrucomicrobia bacterium]|nr:GreA/GreB family elongation factor [Verrucomicrobiota bacterium]